MYEVGELEGQTFVAMELVRGSTVRAGTWERVEPRLAEVEAWFAEHRTEP